MTKKRGNGEGSITRYKDGRWCGRYWTRTMDGKKKRVAVYGKTKAEVRVKLTKAIAERDAGVVLLTENPTLERYLTRWLNNSVRASVRQKTYESYEYVMYKHLIPSLGAKKLKNLTPDQVQDFYQRKLDEGLSRRTVHLIHTTLNKALKQAAKWVLVHLNVAEAVDAPRPEKKDIRPLSQEQVKFFLNTVKGDRLEAVHPSHHHRSSTGRASGAALGGCVPGRGGRTCETAAYAYRGRKLLYQAQEW